MEAIEMHPFTISLLRLIYPIELPSTQRDRPLQVLALGISRSGTESLRQALLELEYRDCYHGFKLGSSKNHAIQWIRLSYAQLHNDAQFLTATEFDRVLGDCAAVTDIPAAGFAQELLAAYPDAKVVLNYRDDVDAWAASCINTIEKITAGQSWHTYLLTFFQPNLFWRQRSYWWIWGRHVNSDFERNGKSWYRRHYQVLEENLRESQRGFLRWKVEDGWLPLCEFLGKPVPELPFPKGNAPDGFLQKVAADTVAWESEARRNMGLVLGVLLSTLICFAALALR